jgi:hypothetical protein
MNHPFQVGFNIERLGCPAKIIRLVGTNKVQVETPDGQSLIWMVDHDLLHVAGDAVAWKGPSTVNFHRPPRYDSNICVVIVGYRRPDYLRQLLSSVRHQTVYMPNPHLFLDGPSTPDDVPLIEQCARVFAENFPKENIHRAEQHGGSIGNFSAALEFGFQQSDMVLTLEEDLVMCATYYQQMCCLTEFLAEDPDVAMWSGWGLESRGWTEQQIGDYRDYLLPMHQHCGAVMKRSAWELVAPHVEPLRAAFRQMGGAMPAHQDFVYDYLRKLGLYPEGLGADWDEFYRAIIHYHQQIAVTTPFRLLRHIGEQGTNNNPTNWKQMWSTEALSVHDGMSTEHPFLDKNHRGFWHQVTAYAYPDWKERVQRWGIIRTKGISYGPV